MSTSIRQKKIKKPRQGNSHIHGFEERPLKISPFASGHRRDISLYVIPVKWLCLFMSLRAISHELVISQGLYLPDERKTVSKTGRLPYKPP